MWISSDNGPEMETWPDAAFTPFRCAKGSTWEGGVRVPSIFSWPGMIEPGARRDGLFSFSDLLPTVLTLAGAPERVPDDRFVDGVDQTSFLLAPDGLSNRKYQYYWLGQMFSALRVGECKYMLGAISDDDRDVAEPGGFTGVGAEVPYGRLYNLYLDPKETHSYLIRKLAYLDADPGRDRRPRAHVLEAPAQAGRRPQRVAARARYVTGQGSAARATPPIWPGRARNVSNSATSS